MDLRCDDTAGSLVDEWWDDRVFDGAFQVPEAMPGTDDACPILSLALSPFDVDSAYDRIQNGLEQELDGNILSGSSISPPALSPNIESALPITTVPDTGLFQEAVGLSSGQRQHRSSSSLRRKRSHSQSSDTSRKLRNSPQTSSSSSRSSSVGSDGMPAAYVRKTSPKAVSGNRQPPVSRKLAPATLSSPKTEANEGKRGPVGHNAVEKRYRDKINAQFHRLLCALPNARSEHDDGRSLSKASVLELALQAVQKLEAENQVLYQQVEQLNDIIRFLGYPEGRSQDLTGIASE